MKRILFLCFISFSFSVSFAGYKPAKEIYQLTVYHYSTDSQGIVLNKYLQDALLPALHRAGITKIGVFTAIANDTSANKLLYVFMPVKKMDIINKLADKLNNDNIYLSAGAEYLNAVYTKPPYTRMEVILLKAFPMAAQMQLPVLTSPKKDRVYELRSYESATEKIFANKVKMFNEGDEIGLFKRLGFNAVFYSSVLAGSKMPNLLYMTCFENMADRNAHWKIFGQDPYWKKISTMPEYQHNVSHIDIVFLHPAEFSDF